MKKLSIYFFILYFFVGLVFVFAVPPFQKPDEKAHYNKVLLLTHLPTKEHIDEKDYRAFPVISYIPYLPAAWAGFYAGRLSMFLFCFVWLIVLFRKAKAPFSIIALFIASFPVFIQQITAYSYDAVLLMSGLTFFLLITAEKIRPLLIVGALILVLFTKVAGYEALLLLLFFPKLTKKYSLTILLSIGVILIFKYFAAASLQGSIHARQGADPTLQLLLLLQHPFAIVLLILKTTYARFGFYTMSMVGVLGWLNYGIPHWLYFIYGGAAINIIAFHHVMLSKKQLLLLAITLLFGYVSILLLLYLQWTHIGDKIVDGVQGRYFLPFAPFVLLLILAIKSRFAPLPAPLRYHTFLSGAVMGIVAIAISVTVFGHFGSRSPAAPHPAQNRSSALPTLPKQLKSETIP